MSNPCQEGQVMDKVTKTCRAPLKRGRKSNANVTTKVMSKSKSKSQSKSNKPCPEGQVLDKATKACRAPLKRGRRTAKRAESPRLNQDNTTLDKFGFVIPKYKPKPHNEPKPMKQTTLLAFSKKGVQH
jgi:hypothetical protein